MHKLFHKLQAKNKASLAAPSRRDTIHNNTIYLMCASNYSNLEIVVFRFSRNIGSDRYKAIEEEIQVCFWFSLIYLCFSHIGVCVCVQYSAYWIEINFSSLPKIDSVGHASPNKIIHANFFCANKIGSSFHTHCSGAAYVREILEIFCVTMFHSVF